MSLKDNIRRKKLAELQLKKSLPDQYKWTDKDQKQLNKLLKINQ